MHIPLISICWVSVEGLLHLPFEAAFVLLLLLFLAIITYSALQCGLTAICDADFGSLVMFCFKSIIETHS